MARPQISIVIPLYNESGVIDQLVGRLESVMDSVSQQIEVVLVDDGSRDDTALKMQALAFKDARYQCIFLARNYGHQMALSAGLAAAQGTEAIMIMDGDLQDPPEMLSDFYNQLQQGYEVIYAVREKRKEGIIKKGMYKLFYRLLQQISYIDLPLDSGDFSMISRRVANILNSMPEESRYIRGMRAWVGLRQIGIPYERAERIGGESKYSIRQLFRLAYNGIFNFSELPVRFITRLGIFVVLSSLIYLGYTLFKKLVFGNVPEGFTATLLTIILFSGVQLISLGVIGEYVLRIFFQVKNRPLYIVSRRIINQEEQQDG